MHQESLLAQKESFTHRLIVEAPGQRARGFCRPMILWMVDHKCWLSESTSNRPLRIATRPNTLKAQKTKTQ